MRRSLLGLRTAGSPLPPEVLGFDAAGVPSPLRRARRFEGGARFVVFLFCGRLWCGREVGNRRRVGNLHGKASGGDRIGGVGKGREAGSRAQTLETHKSSAGSRGARAVPAPSPPGGLRESGRASQGTGGAAPGPGSGPGPVPARGGPGLRFPRAFAGVGARLNCENRDFLPAKGGFHSLPKPCPARNGPAPGGDTRGTPRGHQSFLLHYIAEIFPIPSLRQSSFSLSQSTLTLWTNRYLLCSLLSCRIL